MTKEALTFDVDVSEGEELVLLLTSGPCEGVKFTLHNIHMKEDEDDVLAFDYRIVSEHEELRGTPEFEEQLGLVMHKILEESVKLATKSALNEESSEDDNC